jgi:hypothetical protein
MTGIPSWRGAVSTRLLSLWFSVAVGAGFAPQAQACYSGLILIPTTDVAGAYVWVLDIQWQGYSNAMRTDHLVFNTEAGVGDRLELGIDVDASSESNGRRVRFNAKYVVVRSQRCRFALAIGTQNMDQSFTPHPYIVATEDWGPFRTHAGLQRESVTHRTNWFVGLDRTFEDSWQVMADYTSGQENYASAGAGFMGKSWQVFVGAQWPNAGGPPVAVLHVIFTGNLKRGRR